MAVLTAKGISRIALELLQRQLVLPRTVTNVPGDEFVGPNGGTLTLRVPQPGASRTQASAGAALTADDVTEIPVDVSLAHVYHLKNITDQEASYNLYDFARQVTRVQMGAVATGAEDKLVAVMNALAADAGYQFDLTPGAGTSDDQDEDTKKVILKARTLMGTNFTPMEDRFLAVSPSIASRLLHLLTPVVNSGTTDALRDAVIGRIYGFNVVEVPTLTDGTAIAYHRSAFAFANRAPALPKGATASSLASSQGISVRQVFQYDAGHAQDQSLVSTMVGAAAVYENGTGADGTTRKRFVKIDTSAS